MAAGSVYDNNSNNAEYKYMSERFTDSNSSRRSAGANLYKKHTDEFRRALTSGFYAKSGVRVLQPQVRPQCLICVCVCVCAVCMHCVVVVCVLCVCAMQCKTCSANACVHCV